MATRTASLAPTNNTDANFRLWINEINNALIAYGWTAGADTGQINFSTVTRPTANNTYQGFAIYKMGDSLQSTVPVIMRIDFGTGGATDIPAIKLRVNIGTTDGAGTMTVGQPDTGTLTMNPNGTASATTFNCRSSGSTNRFVMAFWPNDVSNAGLVIAVERDHDTSGADTSLGIQVVTGYGTGGGFTKTSQFLDRYAAWPTDTIWYGMTSSQATQVGGGNTGIGVLRVAAGPFRPPMYQLAVVAVGDFTMATTGTVTLYGSSHTFMWLRPNIAGNINLNSLLAACAFGMLWE